MKDLSNNIFPNVMLVSINIKMKELNIAYAALIPSNIHCLVLKW